MAVARVGERVQHLVPVVGREELGADAELFTADRVLGWQVDWDNFHLEYPWVRGSVGDWQGRLYQAIQGTFGSSDGGGSPAGMISA